ncbi:uncharacterized protein TA12130 [Theileria annulata]|uniref:Uncharacterized protein n=1 Tax=Theileria annulata TaxID=5874 RepID=Q4UDV3_THEAN|nr:uncharacterized protein TA12130 [Theileria annulata]CAI74736.1 hypothetical protein TA12130 [Theileria annulata]|eukprot:XP_952468.1 hypothetical protein TA12130 [Theileria annulata]
MLLDLRFRKLFTLHDNRLVNQELSKLNLSFDDITELNVSGCHLDDLYGIEVFKNLERLDASNNNISLLDPLVSLNLVSLRLNNNNVEYLYIKELDNGTVVLSSYRDAKHRDSFTKFDSENKKPGKSHKQTRPLEYVDLSSNEIKLFKHLTPGGKLSFEVLNLSNNNISNFNALEYVKCYKTLDLSFNQHLDLKHLNKSTLSDECKVYLQYTRLKNEHLLPGILDRYENILVHHETEVVQHERLVSPYRLHLDNVRNKKFVSTDGEYADFMYEGDSYPSELMTPRYLDTGDVVPNVQYKGKPENRLSQLETESTYDDNENKFVTIPSIENEISEGYEFEKYTRISHMAPNSSNVISEREFETDFNQLDFLISSMELCKKIDMWSDDIKKTLYNDIKE